MALTRLLLLAAGIAGAALMLWGYIGPRYLADFMPFLVLASAVAMVDIWRRLRGRSRRAPIGVSAVIAVVALFTIAANVGMAITPNEEWDTTQVVNYVAAQEAVSNLTGHPLQSNVSSRGRPPGLRGRRTSCSWWATATASTSRQARTIRTVPSELFHRNTWLAVERGHKFQHTFRATFDQPSSGTPFLSLVSAGRNSVSVYALPTARHRLVRVLFTYSSPGHTLYSITPYVAPVRSTTSKSSPIPRNTKYWCPWTGTWYLTGTLVTSDPIVADIQHASAGGQPPALTVTNVTGSTPQPTICRSLVG